MLSVFFGALIGLFGLQSLVLLLPIGVATALLLDYRIGVIFVALVLPFSSTTMLPQAQGFNPVTYAIAGSTLLLILRWASGKHKLVLPPKVILICLVIPLIIGGLIGTSFLHIAQKNLTGGWSQGTYETATYLKQFVYRPLTYILFAVLVANIVSASKNPQRFVYLFAIMVTIPVLVLSYGTLASGVGLGEHRSVVSSLGMHYNEYGKLLAFAFGPMLYVTFSARGGGRLFFGVATLLVLVGIALTFARAAYMAVLITFIIFTWQSKQMQTKLSVLAIAMLLLIIAPTEILERAVYGLDPYAIADARAGSQNEAFSSGRVGGWLLLAPDVQLSPIFGRGTSATAWSTAVSRGDYISTHPHSLYLGILLDLGIVGLILLLYLYYKLIYVLRQISRREDIHEILRAFFAGSAASFIGLLVLSFTGGYWYPHVEQSYFWFCIGLAFCYWPTERLRRNGIGQMQ
jgi:O-antigen ligase